MGNPVSYANKEAGSPDSRAEARSLSRPYFLSAQCASHGGSCIGNAVAYAGTGIGWMEDKSCYVKDVGRERLRLC